MLPPSALAVYDPSIPASIVVPLVPVMVVPVVVPAPAVSAGLSPHPMSMSPAMAITHPCLSCILVISSKEPRRSLCRQSLNQHAPHVSIRIFDPEQLAKGWRDV